MTAARLQLTPTKEMRLANPALGDPAALQAIWDECGYWFFRAMPVTSDCLMVSLPVASAFTIQAIRLTPARPMSIACLLKSPTSKVQGANKSGIKNSKA